MNGHSTDCHFDNDSVIEIDPKDLPEALYHKTVKPNVNDIKMYGLCRMDRIHVHTSTVTDGIEKHQHMLKINVKKKIEEGHRV